MRPTSVGIRAARHPRPMSQPAVERLFEEHHVELYRYLVRLTGDADLAADAAQEAFVRLLQRPQVLAELAAATPPATVGGATEGGTVPNAVPHRAARAWLYRVATNVALDEARTARRRRGILAAAPERAPLADPAPAADDLAEARERHARAEAALAALAPRDRTALLMREAGFSHREIAEAVDTTTGSVGTVLARALTRLVAALGGSCARKAMHILPLDALYRC